MRVSDVNARKQLITAFEEQFEMTVNWRCIILAAFTCICLPATIDCVSPLTYDRNKLLNWCLQSKHHKESPGEEMNLYDQCKPWQTHSCCSKETTRLTHQTFQNQYNFDLNHCRVQTKPYLSKMCSKHFIRDLCFYECEPSIGLWVVKVKKKFASERFFEVPLCASSCEQWWNACRNDFTCAYNWHTDFKWVDGMNRCVNSTCRQFKDIYRNAADFCEAIWDKSWKYTDDQKPCMKLDFDVEFHNRRVAEYYVDIELSKINKCHCYTCNVYLFIFSLLMSLLVEQLKYSNF